MLKRMTLKNFTVFPKADLQFASGLNVMIGENGCGKTHLLKVVYALITTSAIEGQQSSLLNKRDRSNLQQKYREKLHNTFKVNDMSDLHRKSKNTDDMDALDISLFFENSQYDLKLHYTFLTIGSPPVKTSKEITFNPPIEWSQTQARPVFMPTRELLTIYPGFISLYDNHYLEFDETYRDTCGLLGLPALKGKREQQAKEMLKPLEEAMGGEVLLEGGRFYLNMPDKGKIEMPMVAEGQRKLAMLAQLIATGALLDQGYLFWDEPEANLNPKLIKLIANVILHLCNNGIQVFIATHSLFLLRELEILSEKQAYQATEQRYFALRIEDNGVIIEQGDSPEDLQTLILLDEELSQSDRFMQMEG